MKPLLLLLCILFSIYTVSAQNNQWAWMSGDSTVNKPGVYGTRGVNSSANKPGSRFAASTWTDAAGNLWLLGGATGVMLYDYIFGNDLWKYAPSTGEWTWVSGDSTANPPGVYGTKGLANAGNKPGARGAAASWMDAQGNLWLFGGIAYTHDSDDVLNDLWKYTPSTNAWTWMGGDSVPNVPGAYGTKGISAPGNKPGSRGLSVSWTDATGNIWLFGGDGYGGSGYTDELNDLWKYTPSTGQWTWIGGDTTSNQPGVYGTKGVASAANKPKARDNSTGWTDASGNLWLFGGVCYPSVSEALLNDLWKYIPSTGQWTWMGGDSIPGGKVVYGTKGSAASGNIPGARAGAVSWTDAAGNFLLFGGNYYNPNYNTYYEEFYNDLWRYTPSTGQWAWISGDSTIYQSGVYGTKGTASPANKPGARANAAGWAGAGGSLWLFGGGYEYAFSDSISFFNDLWRYTVPAAILPVKFISFTAQKQPQAVLLNWTTTREQNMRYFIVERSATATIYDSIGNVTATGTSPTIVSAFTDKAPLQGTSYYRLKQVGMDGASVYSSIARIDRDNDFATLSVLPNPVHHALQLKLQLPSTGKLTLQVSDIRGHVLISEEHASFTGTWTGTLPVDRLAPGVYVITVQTGNLSRSQTFVKQ